MSDNNILRAAGKRGKTKAQIADDLGIGHSYVSRRVNELVKAGQLQVTGIVRTGRAGRPALRFGRVAT